VVHVFDIDPATVRLFREKIIGAGTVLWNGPMGVFELPPGLLERPELEDLRERVDGDSGELVLARRIGADQDFIAALGRLRKFARGPKPGRALREIGLEPQVTTDKPTSEGIAEMLARVDLGGHRLGLQLYPDKDHSVLIGAITAH